MPYRRLPNFPDALLPRCSRSAAIVCINPSLRGIEGSNPSHSSGESSELLTLALSGAAAGRTTAASVGWCRASRIRANGPRLNVSTRIMARRYSAKAE